jgi:tetratricopeptide (TPR) repeat protein
METGKICGLILVVCLASVHSHSAGEAEEHEHPVPEKLGRVQFPVSCSTEAQKDFERGVALLHSFAYSAAEKAFAQLIKAHPDCAMAHWGVAMSYFHQLWEPPIAAEKVGQGQAEIERAKELGGSDRERGFINALRFIYANADSMTYEKRLDRYAMAMEELAKRYSDDPECQIFYALALIATAPASDASHEKQKAAVAILEPLVQKHPDHPGIAHYLIHACDNSEMAKHAVNAARSYSQIAPSAPHALHMPSHIYTRLGMWKESIASNSAARAAARDQGDAGEELHAMDYLAYAYLQLGRDAEVADLLDDLRSMPGLNSSEFKVGYAASAIPARYAIERGQWEQAAQLPVLDRAQPQVRAITLWSRSVGMARNGNPTAARREIEKLKAASNQVRVAKDDYWAAQVDVQIKEALAWVEYAEGKSEDAVKLMRSAADQEDAIEKRPVTPGAIVPAREQLGELLLQAGQPKEALQEFKSALAQTPQRRGASTGAARAAAAMKSS